MDSFLVWLESESYRMTLLIHNNTGRKLVTTALKQSRIKDYHYLSKQNMKLDTGRNTDAKFVLSLPREQGEQFLKLLNDLAVTLGFENAFHAGVDAYYD